MQAMIRKNNFNNLINIRVRIIIIYCVKSFKILYFKLNINN